MSDPIKSPSVLITGAGSGIGLAAARLFASRGWRVGALDVNESALKALEPEIAPAALFRRRVDVSDRAQVMAAVEALGAWTGGTLDLLFSNAGIDAKGPFADMAWDTIRKLVEINLIGGMSLIHAAAPLLKATPNALCLSTASASAIFGAANMAVYSATKHGVRGLTEALAVEFAAHGVRAADLLPGIIDTGMFDPAHRALLPSEGPLRLLSPDAIAEAAWQAYHGDKLHWYVPEELAQLDIEVTSRPEAARDRRIGGALL